MVLPTSRNSLGRAVLPAGTYTQQEIVDFIIKYGEPALVRTTLDLVSTGSMTYKFPDGSIRTVTTAQGLQNVIDAHRDQSVIQSWELSVGDEISMLLREHKGHPEKAFELVYQYTLQPHVDRYIRLVHSENLLKLASNLENFIMFGMVDDAKLLLFGDSMATQIGAGGNLLLKAFSFGGGWSVVLKDGSIVTSQDLIRWADRYGGLPRGQVPAGTFDEAFEISFADNGKLNRWIYRPDDATYIRYKAIYDNPKYFDQNTGAARWPANDGFIDGTQKVVTYNKDTIFMRIGGENGSYLGNTTDTFDMRSLSPSSYTAEIHYYRPTTKIELTTGKVAPWFDSRGGGVQFVKYKPDGSMYTINEMLTNGWLEEITEVILGE